MLLVAACGPAEQARVAAPASPPLREHAVAPAAWRAVLVAGDSSSPAFDNGVDSMRDRLRGQGVHDISVLAADPAAVSGAQLASAANVERSLAARRGEACFAFMTSHGDKRGFYLRANRGLLGPDLLEQALSRGCDGLPTVLIVSACHSGVFINERTRKSNRVILAAAAPDRTSFGCGADDEFTNYDRCLLQQFDVATTWRQLALGVRACVERSERQLNMRASQPQLFIGADVADLRLPGR
jgi:hypothetical protein